MRYCTYCGTQILDSDKVCPRCGAIVRQKSDQEKKPFPPSPMTEPAEEIVERYEIYEQKIVEPSKPVETPVPQIFKPIEEDIVEDSKPDKNVGRAAKNLGVAGLIFAVFGLGVIGLFLNIIGLCLDKHKKATAINVIGLILSIVLTAGYIAFYIFFLHNFLLTNYGFDITTYLPFLSFLFQ